MTTVRTKQVPTAKVEIVKKLADEMKKARTVLVASCKNVPSSTFNDIKKQLRGTAEVRYLKKTAVLRAIDATGKGTLQQLKAQLTSDFALFLSEMDAFSLSGILSERQVPSKARAGEIAPEDIEIHPGPTDLVPGPAISELSGVGLKVAVKEGKLVVIKGAVVAKQGEKIKDNVASVLSKLGVTPMKIGFLPLAAYDSQDDKVYVGIKIDKQGTLDLLREDIRKALGFSVKIGFTTAETIRYLIAKAAMEEKSLAKHINNHKEGK